MVAFQKTLDSNDPKYRNKKPAYTSNDPRPDFMAEMRSHGFKVDALPEIGKIIRVPAPDDKRGKKNGWYIYQEVVDDYQPGAMIGIGVFGSWKGTPDRVVWSSKRTESMSPAERAKMEERIAAAKIARDEDTKQRQQAAAIEATKFWESAKPAQPDHDYFKRKKINPYIARQIGDTIVLPVYCADSDSLSSIQRITPDGDKKFLSGGKTGGCYCKIEGDSETIYIVEGYATGATVAEATGAEVYVAFNANNLMEVASEVRDRYPDSAVVICGDDDAWTNGNPGRSKATSAADENCCEVIFPFFKDTLTKPTDFNDLHCLEGLEAVASIFGTVSDFPAITYGAEFDPSKIPARPWIIQNLLLRGYVTAGFAPGATGKSLLTLMAAVSVSMNKQLLTDGLVREQCNALYINNEDDRDEIDRRFAAICLCHGIEYSELKNRLFTYSGYGNSLTIAKKDKYGDINVAPDEKRLTNFCIKNKIGVIVIDPFVSTHNAPENDNTDIEKVISMYRQIADKTNAAVVLVHHTGKSHSDSEAHAGSPDAGRGASSLVSAVRVAFTLAKMSEKTAKDESIDWKVANNLVRMDDAKSNYSPRSENTKWYQMVSVPIGNGDEIGVPREFDMYAHHETCAKEKAEEKEEDRAETLRDIATQIANCMESDEQPQTEICGLYQAQTGLADSTAKGHFGGLPASKDKAIEIEIEGETVCLWRENIGTNKSLRYLVHKVAKADMDKEPESKTDPESVADDESQEDV